MISSKPVWIYPSLFPIRRKGKDFGCTFLCGWIVKQKIEESMEAGVPRIGSKKVGVMLRLWYDVNLSELALTRHKAIERRICRVLNRSAIAACVNIL